MTIARGTIGLHVEQRGAGEPLLMLHGFTGSAASWAQVLDTLAEYRRCLAIDLIGHGRSDAPADPARYTMAHAVADLLALLDRLAVERCDLLGYSLGGRIALHLALAAPNRVRRLVLESASPGLAEPAERAARVAADEALAAAIERDGVAIFAERWAALPLFASQAALPEQVRHAQQARRLTNRSLGLANSLRGMGTGRQESLWPRLAELALPTLLIVGELDEKFRTIGSAMAAHLPAARLEIVVGAGHAVYLEQPTAYTTLVAEFLQG